jgi:hypothetical protein
MTRSGEGTFEPIKQELEKDEKRNSNVSLLLITCISDEYSMKKLASFLFLFCVYLQTKKGCFFRFCLPHDDRVISSTTIHRLL